jgi:hypothetical protein
MYKITLNPHIGVQIEGLPYVSFGDTKEQVLKAWGEFKEIRQGRVEYTQYGFFADFKADNTFEAIEFWNYMEDFASEVFIYGIEVLQNTASETLAIIKEKNGNIDAIDGWFYNVDVIFSGGNSKNIEGTIAELKREETYEPVKEIWEEELRKSKYFSSFGIGYKGYCHDGKEALQKILNG